MEHKNRGHIIKLTNGFWMFKSLPVCEGGLGALGCICPPLFGTIPCGAILAPGGIMDTEGLFIRIPAEKQAFLQHTFV